MIFAVVPAAGRSRRMGRPKLTLPLGSRTVLEGVLAALADAPVDATLVVVGPHVPELAPLARAAGAEVLLLDAETADMRATVEQGLHYLQRRFSPSPEDGWVLVPADSPRLRAATVRALVDAAAVDPTGGIFVPTCAGRRGHPTFVRWRLVAGLHHFPSDQGLNAYFRHHQDATREVPIDDDGVLTDLDTPEDYERLLP